MDGGSVMDSFADRVVGELQTVEGLHDRLESIVTNIPGGQ